jgi:limonene-1,2-epoxide hydrolase
VAPVGAGECAPFRLNLVTVRPKMSAVDWEGWARSFEQTHGPDGWAALFADGGTFCDPVTPTTTDLRAVAEQTDRIFPDWQQRVERIRGGDAWAFFEWTGVGTYRGPGAEDGPGFTVTVEGATVLDVDGEGLVTRWRDYLDVDASMQQVTAGLQEVAGAARRSGDVTGHNG